MVKALNIRVYGIYINESDEILVSDECEFSQYFTKFPGGGLELGEGTIDCLRREIKEELNSEIKDIKHFYTTDFFQKSAFNSNHQLISIYYTFKFSEPIQFSISNEPFDFEPKDGAQSFRFIPLHDLTPEDFMFPVDKKIAEMLKTFKV
jgi:8-oxo-dGTP diphosphatase